MSGVDMSFSEEHLHHEIFCLLDPTFLTFEQFLKLFGRMATTSLTRRYVKMDQLVTLLASIFSAGTYGITVCGCSEVLDWKRG